MLLMINGFVVWNSTLQLMSDTLKLNILLKAFDNLSDNFMALISNRPTCFIINKSVFTVFGLPCSLVFYLTKYDIFTTWPATLTHALSSCRVCVTVDYLYIPIRYYRLSIPTACYNNYVPVVHCSVTFKPWLNFVHTQQSRPEIARLSTGLRKLSV